MSVVVLGSANVDLVVRASRHPRPGETMFGSSFATGAGGKGLNQAVAARRAGAEVRFLGAVGDDDFGATLRDALGQEGIDATLVQRVVAHTGIAQITVTDDGENSIIVVPGANASAEFSAADRAAVAGATHLVAQFERPLPLLRTAFAAARDAGVTTVLTPAPVIEGGSDLLDLTDILVPNEAEARALAGEDDTERAARALSLRAGTVITTLGARGAMVARAGEIVERVDGLRVEAVDTTAAGDTFVGVLVAWLAEGQELASALRAATAGAALCVTGPGASASMPQRAEILAAL